MIYKSECQKEVENFQGMGGAAQWIKESTCSFCLLLLCLLWPDDLSAQVTCHLFCSFTQEWPSERHDTDPSSYLSQFPNQILDWSPVSLIWWQGQTTNLAHLHLVILAISLSVCLDINPEGKRKQCLLFRLGVTFSDSCNLTVNSDTMKFDQGKHRDHGVLLTKCDYDVCWQNGII